MQISASPHGEVQLSQHGETADGKLYLDLEDPSLLGEHCHFGKTSSRLCVYFRGQVSPSVAGLHSCPMSRVSRKKKKIHDHLFQLLRVSKKGWLGVITCLV
jgi:hypothetical protein